MSGHRSSICDIWPRLGSKNWSPSRLLEERIGSQVFFFVLHFWPKAMKFYCLVCWPGKACDMPKNGCQPDILWHTADNWIYIWLYSAGEKTKTLRAWCAFCWQLSGICFGCPVVSVSLFNWTGSCLCSGRHPGTTIMKFYDVFSLASGASHLNTLKSGVSVWNGSKSIRNWPNYNLRKSYTKHTAALILFALFFQVRSVSSWFPLPNWPAHVVFLFSAF